MSHLRQLLIKREVYLFSTTGFKGTGKPYHNTRGTFAWLRVTFGYICIVSRVAAGVLQFIIRFSPFLTSDQHQIRFFIIRILII